jgi:hypothetical protein
MNPNNDEDGKPVGGTGTLVNNIGKHVFWVGGSDIDVSKGTVSSADKNVLFDKKGN